MGDSSEPYIHRLMSGADTRPAAAMLRAALACAEPVYATTLRARNLLYDAGLFPVRRLPRPVVSVGNITTGGTGKTPGTRFLAERLLARGVKPAVLLRGYKSDDTGGSDEARMLAAQLPAVPIAADPDRLKAAWRVLGQSGAEVFLLDDAFQHRRVHRDFDLVLLNAADPFGYGHVLPRGMLREPMAGLRRAHAFVLTRADQADPAHLRETERTLRRYNADAPVYHATHALTRLLDQNDRPHPLGVLMHTKFFAFAGIGAPQSLHRQLAAFGPTYVGQRWLSDHAAHTAQSLADLDLLARATGAECLVTTEKDWVKLRDLAASAPGMLPVYRLDLRIEFRGDDADRLLEQILTPLRLPASQ